MPRSTVHFPPNVPIQLAIKPDGKSAGNGMEVRYDLADGRILQIPLDIAERITELGINIGEAFWMSYKWSGLPDDPPYYDIWLDPKTEKARARAEAPDLERQLRESLAIIEARKRQPAAVQLPVAQQDSPAGAQGQAKKPIAVSTAPRSSDLPPWAEHLVVHARALVDAYAQCLEHAAKVNPAIRPEDVRSLLITTFIGQQKGQAYYDAA